MFIELAEAAHRGELILADGGMCRWHLRRDGVVTIRELFVLPGRRRQGIGERIFCDVLAARGNGSRVIRCRCPVACESGNAFWRKMGFTLLETKDGLNLWQRPSHG